MTGKQQTLPGDEKTLCVVIPVFHDDVMLRELLSNLARWVSLSERVGVRCSQLVVDGAGDAATGLLAREFGATYLSTKADADTASRRGRGNQIHAATTHHSAAWYWVIHADSQLRSQHLHWMLALIEAGVPVWGRFDVALKGLPLISWFMNTRSHLTKICTGDQAQFVHQDLLAAIGGFPAQPLMEDIELSKRLKRSCGQHFVRSNLVVETSSRRWREQGVVRTVLFMWWTRWRYWLGTDPAILYRSYYGDG